MTTGTTIDPFFNFNFTVEIDGITVASFKSVSGFDSTVETVEFREGGDPTMRKLPGRSSYTNVQLKRGLTDDLTLYNWHKSGLNGAVIRKNVSIIVYDRSGTKPVATWTLKRAWPTKYNGPELDAEQNLVAIEMLELAHEGLERAGMG